MSTTRRQLIKKAVAGTLLGLCSDGGFAVASSRTRRLSSYKKPRFIASYKDLPEGVFSLRQVRLGDANLYIMGVFHIPEHAEEHSLFISNFLRANNVDLIGLESERFLSVPVFNAHGKTYFIQLARRLRKSLDKDDRRTILADVGGPGNISSSPFMVKDFISGTLYSYVFLMFLKELLNSSHEERPICIPAAMLGTSWALVRLVSGSGQNLSRNPYELFFDLFFADGEIKRDTIYKEWLRYPFLMQADMLFARFLRKASEDFDNILLVCGAFHSIGTEVALLQGLDALIDLSSKHEIPVLLPNGKTQNYKI